MIIRAVSKDEYYGAFPTSRNVFTSRAFIEVTPGNAEAVRFFMGIDDSFRPRLGLVAGYRDGEWHAPYSAPFSAIHYNKPQQLETIYDFISELTDTLAAPLHITLPSDYYDPGMLPKFTGILGNFARKKTFDFDFYYPTSGYCSYIAGLDHSARKNLNRAMAAGFRMEPTTDVHRAYEVIRINREAHSYRLAMTEEQVRNTIDVVKADMFVMTLDGTDVAAAIVFHVAEGIVQVVYWGDVPGYGDKRPMNLLPYLVFGHYASTGIRIVDVGPSSTDGIPNTGLCRFKESVGCRISLRPTFVF